MAGIYGNAAVHALDDIRDAQHKIDTDNDEITADANLMSALNLATRGISEINTALQAALPVLQLFEGVWSSIADEISLPYRP